MFDVIWQFFVYNTQVILKKVLILINTEGRPWHSQAIRITLGNVYFASWGKRCAGDILLCFSSVVLNLYKHAKLLRSFLSFCQTHWNSWMLEQGWYTDGKSLKWINGIKRWSWLACFDITILSVIFPMTFVEPLKQLCWTLGVWSNSG